MIGIDPTTTTSLSNLLTKSLYSDEAVGARNGWKALRNRSRPTHIIVWQGVQAIMDVDMENLTVAPLTSDNLAPNVMSNIATILRGGHIEGQFVPAKKGILAK